MKILGVTGGSGSGKSTVCHYLEKHYGAGIIDADEIGHDIILRGKPAYKRILETFGTGILNAESEIDRKKLGSIVFGDPTLLEALNGITFRFILDDVASQISQTREKQSALCVIDCALLFQTRLPETCDDIWIVEADPAVRLERIMAREGVSREYAASRIQSQKPMPTGYKVIDNSGDLKATEKQILKYIKELIS